MAEQTPTRRTCKFWVAGKNKFCGVPPMRGSDFCPTHDPRLKTAATGSNEEDERVVCPRDAGHTVLRSELIRHLRVCTGTGLTRAAALPFYARAFNAEEEEEKQQQQQQPSSSLWSSPETVRCVAAWIRNRAGQLTQQQQQQHPRRCVLRSEAAERADRELFRSASGSKRHLPQLSSLVAHIIAQQQQQQQQGGSFGGQGVVLAELGCGNAHLAKLVAASAAVPPRVVLLFDRQRFACKAEKQRSQAEQQPSVSFVRFQIDIADINMARVPEVEDAATTTVGLFGKHLCGSGCDVALRCAANLVASRPQLRCSIAIALCCFHRCTLDSYCNPGFVLDKLGLPREHFSVLCKMTAWATSEASALSQSSSTAPPAPAPAASDSDYVEFSPAERLELGMLARAILATGRVLFLREHGFPDAELVEYIDRSVTPENLLLLATTAARQEKEGKGRGKKWRER